MTNKEQIGLINRTYLFTAEAAKIAEAINLFCPLWTFLIPLAKKDFMLYLNILLFSAYSACPVKCEAIYLG